MTQQIKTQTTAGIVHKPVAKGEYRVYLDGKELGIVRKFPGGWEYTGGAVSASGVKHTRTGATAALVTAYAAEYGGGTICGGKVVH